MSLPDEPEAGGALPSEHDSARAEHTDEPPDPHERRDSALVAIVEATDDGASQDSEGTTARTWRQELPRWLATLNSKRTRQEYEKAVRYFLLAPGVPLALADLTLDLLLAYRGSLALRADRQTTTSGGRATTRRGARQVGSGAEWYLGERVESGSGPDEVGGAEIATDGASASTGQRPTEAPGPLAPATVNVRLTALRQFLSHCSLWGLVPQLPPERMRAALRRLAIERRRPYQILAEPEWAAFLAAARASGARAATAHTSGSAADPTPVQPGTGDQADSPQPSGVPPPEVGTTGESQASVWGVPRAVRQRSARDSSATDIRRTAPTAGAPGDARGARPLATIPPGAKLSRPVRSRAGLTGERTALRDHALLALALATGLRAIELCALDLGDLTREWHAGQEEWWLVLPDAKTKGQHGGRTLPLAPALLRVLLEYVKSTGRQWEHAAHRATPLFLSQRRAPADRGAAHSSPNAGWPRLSTEQVRRIVDRVETQWIASSAGAQGPPDAMGHGEGRAISPHALRHSTAVALLEGNERSGRAPASVEHVRGWLGHFDIRTTQGYLAHLDARRHRRPFVLQPAEESAPATDERDADSHLRSAQQE